MDNELVEIKGILNDGLFNDFPGWVTMDTIGRINFLIKEIKNKDRISNYEQIVNDTLWI